MTEHHNTLLVNGKGQAKEGAGHDAFADMSYELLNRIRISEVKVEQNQITVRGDATAAYLPAVGLRKFVREFVYRPSEGFTINDEIETAKPSLLTLLFHADDNIEQLNNNRFTFINGRVGLRINSTIAEPANQRFQSAIETNTVTAPGPPGAVDKGVSQARGQKLLLTTRAPTMRARFVTHLTID